MHCVQVNLKCLLLIIYLLPFHLSATFPFTKDQMVTKMFYFKLKAICPMDKPSQILATFPQQYHELSHVCNAFVCLCACIYVNIYNDCTCSCCRYLQAFHELWLQVGLKVQVSSHYPELLAAQGYCLCGRQKHSGRGERFNGPPGNLYETNNGDDMFTPLCRATLPLLPLPLLQVVR